MSSHLYSIAYFVDDPPEGLRTPIMIRSPGLIIKSIPTISDDIWVFGCLVFKLLTGRCLSMVHRLKKREDTEDQYLLNLLSVIGPVPLDLLSKWPRSDLYFNAEGKNIKNHVGERPEGFDPSNSLSLPSSEELFDKNKPAELSDEDAR
jgi:hypothetical protein